MPLIVQKEIEAPMFGVKDWQAEDYKTAIEFELDGAKTSIYLVGDKYGKATPRKVQMAMGLLFAIRSDNPAERILRSLRARGKATAEAGVWIHNLYLKTISRFDSLLRVHGGVRNLFDYGDKSLSSFYSSSALTWKKVHWSTDGEHFQVFEPFIPKGRGRRFACSRASRSSLRRSGDACNSMWAESRCRRLTSWRCTGFGRKCIRAKKENQ